MSAEDIFDQGARPMPEFVKRGLVRVKSGNLYLKAPYRVLWMREEHPDWGIEAELLEHDADRGFALFKATIKDGDGRVMAVAHADASRGPVPYLRTAETSAIARALGLCGYGTIFGELEDEEFADAPQAANGHDRQQSAPASSGRTLPINDASGPCVSCNAPARKPHTRNCKAVRA